MANVQTFLPKLLIILLLSSNAFSIGAGSCENLSANDPGFRALVQSVYSTNSTTLSLEKLAGIPETPIKALPDNVNLEIWCRCVQKKEVETYGRKLADSLQSWERTVWMTWFKNLSPDEQRKYLALDSSGEAVCYNQSLAKSSSSESSTTEPPRRRNIILRFVDSIKGFFSRKDRKKISAIAPAEGIDGGGGELGFESLMKSTFKSGNGIAGLEIGTPAANLIARLGQPTARKIANGGESFQYGPLPAGFEVIVAPTGSNAVITQIWLTERYQGATDLSVRIRDGYEVVKRKMSKGKLIYFTEIELLYDDGMFFFFNNSTPKELIRIALFDPRSPNFEKYRRNP